MLKGSHSFNSREARNLVPFQFENVINTIDWNRVVIQAIGEHTKTHANKPLDICGECIKIVLLREE